MVDHVPILSKPFCLDERERKSRIKVCKPYNLATFNMPPDQQLTGKNLIISIIALSVLATGGYFGYKYLQSKIAEEEKLKQEIIKELTQQEKTLQELEKQRELINSQYPNTKTTEEQLKELEALRKESAAKPLTQEEIQKQLEELDKLRQQQ